MRFFIDAILGSALLASVAVASPIQAFDQAKELTAKVLASSNVTSYEVRNFAIHKPASNGDDLWTVSFNVYDPTPKANVAAPCYGSWKSIDDAGLINRYVTCGKTHLAWGFKSFKDQHNFVLQAEDTYEDNSVGDPPYNHITTFARGTVSSKNLTCVESSSGAETCTQKPFSGTMLLPIWGAIA